MNEPASKGFFVARILRGFGCLLRGAGLIVSSVRIFLLSAIPFFVCLAIYAALFVLALSLADNLVDLIVGPGSWWRSIFRVAFTVAVDLVLLLVLVFTYASACFVLAAPLYEFLSAAVEKRVAGRVEEEPFSLRSMVVDVWRALTGAVVILAIEIAVLVFGLLLGPPGAVAAALASGWLLSLEYLDYPMGRRRMRLREKLAFGRRHAWELLGLGLPMVAGLAVPFVGVVFLPLGVVGGTLLFVDLAPAGRTDQD